MADSYKGESLQKWIAIEKENFENEMVASMLSALLDASEKIDQLSNWMLLGSAGIASAMLANASLVISVIGAFGFKVCASLLIASFCCSMAAKLKTTHIAVGKSIRAAIKPLQAERFAAYKEKEKEMQRQAKIFEISIETDIDMSAVVKKFLSYAPTIVRFSVNRGLEKRQKDPQVAYAKDVRHFFWQGALTGAQALLFLGFFITAFWFAANSA